MEGEKFIPNYQGCLQGKQREATRVCVSGCVSPKLCMKPGRESELEWGLWIGRSLEVGIDMPVGTIVIPELYNCDAYFARDQNSSF